MIKTASIAAAVCLLAACERSSTSTDNPEQATPSTIINATKPSAKLINTQALLSSIRQQGSLALQQSHRNAQALVASVESFLQQGDQQHWQQLQQQWLSSHQQWHQSDSYLQLLAPNYPLSQLRLSIHSIQVTPGYLDHIEGYPHSGIVHDSTLPLNAQTLQQQHRRYSDDETALGIHVLEFFIWERDREAYRIEKQINPQQVTAEHKQQQLSISRRRQYLHLLVQQWLADIKQAQQFWQHQDSQILAAADIKMNLQQQLGALADNSHCQFSQDNVWRSAVVEAASKHIESHPSLDELLRQFAATSTATEADLKQAIGELMLNLRLKAQ